MELKQETIVYVLLLVVPGFLATRVFNLFITTRPASSEKEAIVTHISVGTCLLAVTLPLELWLVSRIGQAAALFIAMAVWPSIAGAGAGMATRSDRILALLQRWRIQAPHATAWDHFFYTRPSAT